MKDKNKNYLDFVPICAPNHTWHFKEDGIVVVTVQNKGFYNKIAQKFFKRPKTSYIELDEYGSYIWQQMDGKNTIFDISKMVREKYGDQAEPILERLTKYFKVLYINQFIGYVGKKH